MIEGQETQALTSSAKWHSQMKRHKVFQGQKAQDATQKINLLKLKEV
jgi:ribosomal protein L13